MYIYIKNKNFLLIGLIKIGGVQDVKNSLLIRNYSKWVGYGESVGEIY